jgi:hypothetical protein
LVASSRMKKKFPSAKFPLPKFRSEKEAAEYFDGRSVAAIWDQLAEVKPAKLSAALAKKVHERHARAKAAHVDAEGIRVRESAP